jgi:porin
VELAQPFLHQSTGASATLFTLPTYPDAALGINVFVKPASDLQIGFGVYDGSLAEGVRTGELGFQPLLHGGGGAFLIGEVDKTWKLAADQLQGRIGVGGWYSTNDFARLDGGEARGTGGPYALLEQSLWRANSADSDDARGIGMFVMYGSADPAIVQFAHNIGGGITWTGAIPGRDHDIIGAGAQAVRFSHDFDAQAAYEVSYELFYKVQATPWFVIQPDLQYIANPGGHGTPDALALSVRMQVNF